MRWPEQVVPILLAWLLAGILILAAPQGSRAAFDGIDHAREYRACMILAKITPEEALQGALAWESQGGDDAARHCAGVALIGLERYAEGAKRLQALAATMRPENALLRAEVLGQAGQAWLLAGEPERAHAAQSAALELDRDNLELWVDRSITLAMAENYWRAIDDLNRALEIDPKRADVLIFRASAYRYVDALDLALEDVTRALAFEPENPEGLLERGILRRLAGDEIGARVDWLQVIELAAGTTAGGAAKANLELLDVKTE